MSDHFDHYKRPPSRDNSVDRYTRAASRLSGGSRQSSVEKQQQQQQQPPQQQPRRVDDTPPPSDNSFGSAGRQSNFSTPSQARQPPPFEEIILRQRNIGQEIVPSPVGQPKRTESLYVNPNSARKEIKPKVSTTGRSSSADGYYGCYGGSGGGSGGSSVARKPRLLPPPPPVPPRRLWPRPFYSCFSKFAFAWCLRVSSDYCLIGFVFFFYGTF